MQEGGWIGCGSWRVVFWKVNGRLELDKYGASISLASLIGSWRRVVVVKTQG